MLSVLFFSAVFKEKLRDSRRHKAQAYRIFEFGGLCKAFVVRFYSSRPATKTFIGSWNCFHPPMDQNQQRFASIGDFLWLQEDSGSRRRHSTNN